VFRMAAVAKRPNHNERLCRAAALGARAAVSSVAPIGQLSGLPASWHRTHPSRPLDERHCDSTS
jgi:hypothetical protein